MANLHIYLDEFLKDATTSEQIHDAINRAYDKAEQECYDKLKGAFEIGFPKAATVGACALVTVVKGNKLYVANAGDCEGVLLRRNDDGTFETIKICKPFTCNDPEEQQRLKEAFPDDPEIIRCSSPDACYVKGSLMPSRAIGDFRLKHEEFNFHNKNFELGYRPPLRNFKGPYITHRPEIREFDLTSKDQYIVLATDGIWEEIKTEDVGSIIKDSSASSNEIGKCLFNQ